MNTQKPEQTEPRYAEVVQHANVKSSLAYVARKTGLGFQEATRLLELALQRGDLPSNYYTGRNLDRCVEDRDRALTQELGRLTAHVKELEAAIGIPISNQNQTLAIPDGWQLVPIEPTTAMLCALMQWDGETGLSILPEYAAMLAAAPQPNT